VATREASDIKVAGMPVPSRDEDTVPHASRTLTVTELDIRETRKWHIRAVFSRSGTVKSCHGDSEHVVYSRARRVVDGE
jgi:hypothetical protein